MPPCVDYLFLILMVLKEAFEAITSKEIVQKLSIGLRLSTHKKTEEAENIHATEIRRNLRVGVRLKVVKRRRDRYSLTNRFIGRLSKENTPPRVEYAVKNNKLYSYVRRRATL